MEARRPFHFVIIATLALLHSSWIEARPVLDSEEDVMLTSAMVYLVRYGYLNTPMAGKSANLLSSDAMKESIYSFQRFAGLNETGELDGETLRMMSLPRCGVKDMVGHGLRAKRYALQGSRWRVKDLTYKISKYPTTKRLTRGDVDAEVARALDVWAEHTDLSFTQKTSGKVHIDIRFDKGEHGDGDPFDGPGGTLAHAFFPVFGGDAHFDDDEHWTSGSFTGTNLLQTAAHEFGHSLGLSHSDISSALMAPFYRGFQSKVELADDDITAIQELYGKREGRTAPRSKPKPLGPREDDEDNEDEDTSGSRGRDRSDGDDEELCNDATIDAITSLKNGTTYVFKGKQYWRLTDDALAAGYPRGVSADWDGLPGNLDAAFTWTNGKTYFFKGSKYWRFNNANMEDGYPKEISKGFKGIPDDIDAVFVWSGNRKIYFFKGSNYYKFDPEKDPPVSRSFPKPISNWEGIPNNIDDALLYSNGYTYFFKGGQYWRFDDANFKVDKADPEFPRPAGFWWFGCSSVSQDVPPVLHRDEDEDGAGDEDLDAGRAGGREARGRDAEATTPKPSLWKRIFKSLFN